MKMSKLGFLYASLCAIVAIVACSGGNEAETQSTGSQATLSESSGATVIDKEVDGGVTTSDAAP